MFGKKYTIPAVLVIVLALSSCFSPWQGGDDAVITLNLGNGNGRAAVSDAILNNLNYTVILTGPTGARTLYRTGAGIITATVTSGNWEINVEAYIDDVLFAIGSGSVNVKAGQNNPVTIGMILQDGGGTEGLEYELITTGSNANTYRVTGYTGADAQVVIPAAHKDTTKSPNALLVTEIKSRAFQGNMEITGVAIPFTMMTIGERAFNNCWELDNVIIPASVKTIGEGAFQSCPGLKNIIISEGVTTIDTYAFETCSGLSEITIPASVKKIGYNAFHTCSNLTIVTFKSGGVNFNDNAFPGYNNMGDNSLWNIYDGAGTYERDPGQSNWTKMGEVNISDMDVGSIRYAIQWQLDKEYDVTVTGDCTISESAYINLTILADRTVTWKANYTNDSNGGNIILYGDGAFILASGFTISSSANAEIISGSTFSGRIIVRGTISAIDVPGNSTMGIGTNAGIIEVDGGTINAKSHAIQTNGTTKVIIRSGTVTNTDNTKELIRLGGDGDKLAILGGNIGDISSVNVVWAFGTSEVYVASSIANGGIWNYENTAKGYYAAGYAGKFRQNTGTYDFTANVDLFNTLPPNPWWN